MPPKGSKGGKKITEALLVPLSERQQLKLLEEKAKDEEKRLSSEPPPTTPKVKSLKRNAAVKQENATKNDDELIESNILPAAEKLQTLEIAVESKKNSKVSVNSDKRRRKAVINDSEGDDSDDLAHGHMEIASIGKVTSQGIVSRVSRRGKPQQSYAEDDSEDEIIDSSPHKSIRGRTGKASEKNATQSEESVRKTDLLKGNDNVAMDATPEDASGELNKNNQHIVTESSNIVISSSNSSSTASETSVKNNKNIKKNSISSTSVTAETPSNTSVAAAIVNRLAQPTSSLTAAAAVLPSSNSAGNHLTLDRQQQLTNAKDNKNITSPSPVITASSNISYKKKTHSHSTHSENKPGTVFIEHREPASVWIHKIEERMDQCVILSLAKTNHHNNIESSYQPENAVSNSHMTSQWGTYLAITDDEMRDMCKIGYKPSKTVLRSISVDGSSSKRHTSALDAWLGSSDRRSSSDNLKDSTSVENKIDTSMPPPSTTSITNTSSSSTTRVNSSFPTTTAHRKPLNSTYKYDPYSIYPPTEEGFLLDQSDHNALNMRQRYIESSTALQDANIIFGRNKEWLHPETEYTLNTGDMDLATSLAFWGIRPSLALKDTIDSRAIENKREVDKRQAEIAAIAAAKQKEEDDRRKQLERKEKAKKLIEDKRLAGLRIIEQNKLDKESHEAQLQAEKELRELKMATEKLRQEEANARRRENVRLLEIEAERKRELEVKLQTERRDKELATKAQRLLEEESKRKTERNLQLKHQRDIDDENSRKLAEAEKAQLALKQQSSIQANAVSKFLPNNAASGPAIATKSSSSNSNKIRFGNIAMMPKAPDLNAKVRASHPAAAATDSSTAVTTDTISQSSQSKQIVENKATSQIPDNVANLLNKCKSQSAETKTTTANAANTSSNEMPLRDVIPNLSSADRRNTDVHVNVASRADIAHQVSDRRERDYYDERDRRGGGGDWAERPPQQQNEDYREYNPNSQDSRKRNRSNSRDRRDGRSDSRDRYEDRYDNSRHDNRYHDSSRDRGRGQSNEYHRSSGGPVVKKDSFGRDIMMSNEPHHSHHQQQQYHRDQDRYYEEDRHHHHHHSSSSSKRGRDEGQYRPLPADEYGDQYRSDKYAREGDHHPQQRSAPRAVSALSQNTDPAARKGLADNLSQYAGVLKHHPVVSGRPSQQQPQGVTRSVEDVKASLAKKTLSESR